MSSEIYVNLSGMLSMNEHLATIADNVANVKTSGFRAQSIKFNTVLSQTRREIINYSSIGSANFDLSHGAIEQTGNPLDVAISGDGWFSVLTPGGVAYTRDGRFTLAPTGELKTLNEYDVLDDGGSPILLNPSDGLVEINSDGLIIQNGLEVARLGVFSLSADAQITRYGNNVIMSNQVGEPLVDPLRSSVKQGFREGSNVNSIRAITELIEVQRMFEYGSSMEKDRHQTLRQVVRTLGAE